MVAVTMPMIANRTRMTIIKESNAAGSRSLSAEPAVDNGFFIDL